LVEEPPRRLRRSALRYWREVLRKINFLFSKGALNRVRWRGDRLLDEAGHWIEAAKALRFTWENDFHKGHTGDIWDAKWEKFIASDLLQYLRTQMYQGARVRQEPTNPRIRTEPHFGATQKILQVWETQWKDVAPGRLLVCSANHPALCRVEADPVNKPGVFSVPINAVDKQNPDRSISTKIRVVTDLRGPNETGDPRNHPPALAPFHREVARAVLWWKHKLPGVPVFLMKQDVDAAFKRVWLRI
jgi:hypothetical protein